MSTDHAQDALDLPGLELPTGSQGHITTAAKATLAALQRDQLLEPRHALTCQVVLALSQAVDRGLAAHRVTVATSTLTKQLLEAIATLPEPAETGSDQWMAFQERLAAAASEPAG